MDNRLTWLVADYFRAFTGLGTAPSNREHRAWLRPGERPVSLTPASQTGSCARSGQRVFAMATASASLGAG